jgi:acyl-CoA thioesterase FadM
VTAVEEIDGYRFVLPVEPRTDDYDAQGHLNNAATVRLFNDLRIEYVRRVIGEWWGDDLRANARVVVARELHVSYDSEARPGEPLLGAMRYTRREGKAAIIEQLLVARDDGRMVARAWVVQLLASGGRAVEWPERYFDAVAAVEGGAVEHRARRSPQPFGPPG